VASIGHFIVGAAAARFARAGRRAFWSPIAAAAMWGGLSLLPDADVIGFHFGIGYADVWGHRGATHSFVFALAVGLLVAVIARVVHLPAVRTGLIATGVVASHALFDTLTDGGLGCALLWPFSDERFFAPFTPLPVAPIGRRFLSIEGLQVAAVELVVFSPFLVYTLWRRKRVPSGAL
jgi:inner membrane protein